MKRKEKILREYLEIECPHYFRAKVKSIFHVGNFKIPIFEDNFGGEVSVYKVILSNGQEAFGTIGGIIPQTPYSNVFHKNDTPDPETAARFHLYWEGVNRFNKFFKKQEDGLERLADILNIPENWRIKE